MHIPDALPVFDALVPDLARRAEHYRVDTSEVDQEVLDLFVTEIDGMLPRLRAAAQSGDTAVLRGHSHSLLGMGGVIGAPEISVVGEELSNAAKAGDWPRCAALAEALAAWMTGFAGGAAAKGSP